MNKEPRFSFENTMTSEEGEKSLNKNLKLKPSKNKILQKKIKENFQEKAKNAQKKLEGHLQKAYELGLEFTKLISDTRISENIGPYDKSFEREIIQKLINYAISVNNDTNEKEGMGSVSLLTLLLNITFKMRNKINETNYKNHLLENRVAQLEKSILSLSQKKPNENK